MIVMMKERKFIKYLIGSMFIDQLERQSLSFYTLSFALKQTHPKAHGRSDPQPCGHFLATLSSNKTTRLLNEVEWSELRCKVFKALY